MIRVAISLIAALLGIASTMPQAAAQAVGPDEAHEAPARVRPVTRNDRPLSIGCLERQGET
jgi:hypothetical protein